MPNSLPIATDTYCKPALDIGLLPNLMNRSGCGGGRTNRRDSRMEALVKSAARCIGSQLDRQIIRGALGSRFKRQASSDR